jgi:Ca-activated chloride channel family protein
MNVEAGLLDFLHIEQANSAYQKQDYEAAAEKFSDIDNDAAHLNQANSLYKRVIKQLAFLINFYLLAIIVPIKSINKI